MGDFENQVLDAQPEVVSARNGMTAAEQQLIDLGIEAGLLVASTSPVGGQIADGISLARNVSAGNYGAAIVDGIGMIPFGGDLIKGFFRGRSIQRRVRQANEALQTARQAVTRARDAARRTMGARNLRRQASQRYWDDVRRRRQEVMDEFKDCDIAACRAERDRRLRQINRLPANGGRWVDEAGNPVSAGSGRWLPDEGTPLHDALSRHQQPVSGVPFNDGKPDFSGFPPQGFDEVPRVEIDMSGNSGTDITAAQRAFRDQTGVDTRTMRQGTWHHEPDGVTMSYVDRKVHTAYQRPDGTSNSGTPHAGGDSMIRDPAF